MREKIVEAMFRLELEGNSNFISDFNAILIDSRISINICFPGKKCDVLRL